MNYCACGKPIDDNKTQCKDCWDADRGNDKDDDIQFVESLKARFPGALHLGFRR